MYRLWTMTAECEQKECDRLLTEQSINGLDYEGMISEILMKVSTLEVIEDAASESVLIWIQRVEV